VAEPVFDTHEIAARRRPVLGYTMVWVAATLFAVNGTVSKVVLESGISSLELTQVRSTGAAVGFGLVLVLLRPRSLRLSRRELPFLVVFGLTGVAFVQWFYFLAIHRLPVGIALLIQYLAPLLIALWARFVMHEPVRRRIWLALVLALAGLTVMVEAWKGGGDLSAAGVAASLAAAGAYAVYVLMAERAVTERDPLSLTCYGFAFAAAFWLVVQPVWRFPLGQVDDPISLLGRLEDVEVPTWLPMLFVVVVGTMVTFGLVVTALRHIPATRVAIVATLEPVVATGVAWVWLEESLSPEQFLGAVSVMLGIVVAQTAR
jgi:drug/metabolite transporter (DMT)-like permease